MQMRTTEAKKDSDLGRILDDGFPGSEFGKERAIAANTAHTYTLHDTFQSPGQP